MSSRDFFGPYLQEDISIRGAAAKSPLFYRDLHMMGAVFTAPLGRLSAALPRGGPAPLNVLGRGFVAVHCLEYKDTDIGPYNEVSLSIAVRRGWLPLASLFQAARSLWRREFHGYVSALPVTTTIALHGGLDYFNYPKYLADITFRETAGHRVCTLRDKESLDVILEFEGRRIPTRNRAPRDQNLTAMFSYPEIAGRPHRATFLVNHIERGSRFLSGARLRLGSHPRSQAFAELGLGPLAHYLFAPRCQAILFRPEPL
ncbi:MAG: acetoacetate decarboxylase family protein [Elusimicrobia bacterium]|nr:acetoacetate decarboxylase family protein [Elusimicrobiota bacterium]